MGRALITGASAGLGTEFAWALAAEGNSLVLVARNEERLSSLARELRHIAGVDVEVLAADLSTDSGVEAVTQRLASQDSPITLLVNNAGMGLAQEFTSGSVEREEYVERVMVRAVMLLSHAAVQAMLARGRGTVINIASLTSLTVQGTYSAHKAWVQVFTEALASDLRGTGVNATVVLPGLMHTEFHQRASVDSSQWPEFFFLSAAQVAQAALDGARRKQVIVVPGLLYKVSYLALRIAPRSLIRRFAGSQLSGRTP